MLQHAGLGTRMVHHGKTIIKGQQKRDKRHEQHYKHAQKGEMHGHEKKSFQLMILQDNDLTPDMNDQTTCVMFTHTGVT